MKVLVIENDEADFRLMVRNLRGQSVGGTFRRVETFPDLVQAVAEGGWDAVISDYNLPGMSFPAILAHLQARIPDVPVILVSGSIGEEIAIALLREGVWAFVSKDRPGRLAPALTHCLAEAGTRKAMTASTHALQASEARYRTLFQNMLSGYAHCRMIFEGDVPVDFLYLDVNDAFERLTGLADMVGRRVSEVIPRVRETNQDLLQAYGRVAATGRTEHLESFVDALGIWFSISVYCPAPGEFVAIFENVTQRKRDEADLRETTDRLRQATLAGGFGVWDWDLSADTLVFDDRMREIYDLQPGEEPGGLNWWKARVHGEDRDRGVEVMVRTMIAGREFDLEFRLLLHDGAIRHVRAYGTVVRDATGRALRVLGLHQDITARKEAEEARRESEAMFLALADNAGDAIFVNDLEGRILEVNRRACMTLGYTREELQAMRVTDLVPDLELGVVQKLWNALEPHVPVTRLSRQRRKDGGLLNVEVTLTPFQMGGRNLLLAMAHDITDRLKAEEERRRLELDLRHAEKLESLGGLASGVAHDMNNVLAAILAVTQVLRLKLVGADPTLAEAMDTILRAGNRGRDLVRGLTNFARKDLRGAEPVDLNQVVQDEADLLGHTLRQKIQLQVDLEPGLPWIMGEPGNLGSALMNLCVNAVDAMPEGGTLTLRTRRLDGDRVELQVEDTGEGMTPEVLGRALEPFYTTKPMGKGTGLGLAMVHGMVKAHGGTLDLQSAKGRGTRISLRLPALHVPAEGPAEAPAAPPVPPRALRVLLVDDDELIRATIPALLGHLGHEAVTVASGEASLEQLAGGLQVDVVILDLNMPGLSGEATYRRLRPLYPNLPVLMASGFLEPATEELLKGDPLAASLGKPYLLEELDEKLHLFLG